MDERWDLLVAGARAMVAETHAATLARFGLDFSGQYEWDTDRAEIVFSRDGVAAVRAELQFVGSVAGREPTWLWGWSNRSVPAVATRRLDEVRRYGAEQGFPKLTEPTWPADADDGHDLMFVSAGILGSSAFFHDHSDGAALFFVLDGFERLDGGEAAPDPPHPSEGGRAAGAARPGFFRSRWLRRWRRRRG